jgi:hypothetical protein
VDLGVLEYRMKEARGCLYRRKRSRSHCLLSYKTTDLGYTGPGPHASSLGSDWTLSFAA